MLNLKRLVKDYEESARTYAELIPWMALLTPNVVVNKDSSLMAVFEFAGTDVDGLQADLVDAQADQLESAFKPFGERMMLWWTVHRRRWTDYPDTQFPNAVSQYIDIARRDAILGQGQFVNRHYLTVVFTPPAGSDKFIGRVTHFLDNEGKSLPSALLAAAKAQLNSAHNFAYTSREVKTAINRFEDVVESFRGAIPMLNMRRLEAEELLTFLHSCTSPTSPDAEVGVPKVPYYLDSYLCSDNIDNSGRTLKFTGASDTKFVNALSIKDWPDSVSPGILDRILAMPSELTFSQAFRFVDTRQARNYMETLRRHHRNTNFDIRGLLFSMIAKTDVPAADESKTMAADETTAALGSLAMGHVYGYYNGTILVMGDTRDQCEEATKDIASVIRQNRMVPLREYHHLLSSFAGTLPGQWAEVVRWSFISGAHVADIAPIRTVSKGLSENAYFTEQRGQYSSALTVFTTEYSTPFNFNLHSGDLGHAFVIGPSRTGKSVLVNLLISQFKRYSPVNLYIFDKDYSCRIPTLLQGGQHVDFGGEAGAVQLNPFHLVEGDAGRRWIANWLEILFEGGNHELTAEDRKEVWSAVNSVCDLADHSEHRLLSLAAYLPEKLQRLLAPWVQGGQFGHLFDNEEDSFTLGNFTCIEMGRLFDNKLAARAFLEYAFQRIETALSNSKQTPTIIYLEECWFLFEDPRFRAKARDWLKTMAKKLGTLIMSTQSLEDLSSSGIFASISDNIPTRIYLPNHNARQQRDLYGGQFGLSDEQIERIASAVPKRNYYIVRPDASRMVDLSMTPDVLACLRSDKRAQSVFDRYYAEASTNSNWPFDYIEEMSRE